MTRHVVLKIALIVSFCSVIPTTASGQPLPKVEVETAKQVGSWKLDKLHRSPSFKWVDKTSRIRSLTYKSEPFNGAATDVFAFYATPGSISQDASKDKNLPAVVLIHGGGGTAFPEWVQLWAKRGYAAIAMDLSGRRPEAPKFNAQTGKMMFNHRAPRTRLETGGPEADHVAKFKNVGGEVSDDWQHHAVAAVLRAHSLIRGFPEVDENRTAVTGISWGGYMTCLVASIDDRFKAAVPVYGCGFLYDGESVQRRMIDGLKPEQRVQWIREYDPSAWLPKCRVPIMFVNGTNDKHYPLKSYIRSYNLVPGKKQIRIQVNMRHSHGHGWAPQEIGLFVDQHIKQGVPLPEIGSLKVAGREMSAAVKSKLSVKKAELHFTIDKGPLVNRKWQSQPASFSAKTKVLTAEIPKNATLWLVSVTDSRDALVSSEPVFVEKPAPRPAD
jgi:dienelactone hydrolase